QLYLRMGDAVDGGGRSRVGGGGCSGRRRSGVGGGARAGREASRSHEEASSGVDWRRGGAEQGVPLRAAAGGGSARDGGARRRWGWTMLGRGASRSQGGPVPGFNLDRGAPGVGAPR